jgi:CHAT domain-containing protein
MMRPSRSPWAGQPKTKRSPQNPEHEYRTLGLEPNTKTHTDHAPTLSPPEPANNQTTALKKQDHGRKVLEFTLPHSNGLRAELSQRLNLMARAWYLAQISPPPDECVRQLNSTSACFLWKGDLFRIPLSTLYRPKTEGGWDLINISTKFRALLLLRTSKQLSSQGTFTSQWMKKWKVREYVPTPPVKTLYRRI